MVDKPKRRPRGRVKEESQAEGGTVEPTEAGEKEERVEVVGGANESVSQVKESSGAEMPQPIAEEVGEPTAETAQVKAASNARPFPEPTIIQQLMSVPGFRRRVISHTVRKLR